MNWTEADYAAYQARQGKDPLQKVIRSHGFTSGKAPVKPSRERNHAVTVDGQRFDSKWEYARWQQLQMEEKAGAISGLKRQVEFVLAPSVVILGRKRPPLRYFLDFRYVRDGVTVYEDAKGKTAATDTYRIKRHLLKSVHGIDITEVRRK